MRKFTRHFRLLLILLAIVAIVLLHWESSFFAKVWRTSLYMTWMWNTDWYDSTLNGIVKAKLEKPFEGYEDEVNQFIKPVMDESGFMRWLHQEGIHDSLIGTAFIWHRDIDTLTVIPLSMKVDAVDIRQIKRLIDGAYRLKYNIRDAKYMSRSRLDSLGNVIERSIGYSIFIWPYFSDNQNYASGKERSDAEKVAFGIVWNHHYYRRAMLPPIMARIEDHPKEVGLLKVDSTVTGFYNGILLRDAKDDTIYSFGRVQLKPDSMLQKFSSWNEIYFSKLRRLPGWRLWVQDHWDVQFINRDTYEVNNSSGDSRQLASALIRVNLLTHWKTLSQLSTIIMAVALVILFSMILVQIVARNRQRDFIAHVSHELRTPVAKVKLFAETLRFDRAVSEEKEDEYLDTILRESDHLSVLVDNTLNLARLDAGRMAINLQQADLSEWLKQVFEKQEIHLTGSGFDIKLTLEPDFPQVKFDPEALELALNNLIDNAVKYSADRKEIEISAAKTGKDKVQIAVSDRGIGIPVNKRKAVFKRFTRIKPKDREPIGGAGVGLSIVKEIVKRHHGRVWCQARDGGGTAFTVELPAAS